MHATLQQLRLFAAVARNLSFTKAADEMHLTQPAVSIQIRRLEEHVGLPLLEHVSRRVYLTPVGQELYDACRDIFQRLDSFEGAVDMLKGEVAGPLRLSVVTTAEYFLPHLLGVFLRQHPRVQPFLNITNRASVLARLIDNEDDLVVMGRVPDGVSAEVLPFLDNVLVVAAPPGHRLADGRAVALRDLMEERFLFRESGSGTRMAAEKLLAEHGLSITPYMELGSAEAIKQGVMAGLGVGVLPLHSLNVELAAGLLAVLNVEGFPLRRPWYAVYRKGKRLTLAARTFIDFLSSRGKRVAAGLDAEP
jgi:DNA-binding transcriptional LysR family regulator